MRGTWGLDGVATAGDFRAASLIVERTKSETAHLRGWDSAGRLKGHKASAWKQGDTLQEQLKLVIVPCIGQLRRPDRPKENVPPAELGGGEGLKEFAGETLPGGLTRVAEGNPIPKLIKDKGLES